MEEEHLVNGGRHRSSSSRRDHSMEEENLVNAGRRWRSSSSRRGGSTAADGHRCSSNHIDLEEQQQKCIDNINDDHHAYFYCHCQCRFHCHCHYHCQCQPANNNISEVMTGELDFRDVFGGSPCNTTNILLRHRGFYPDLGTSTNAPAGGITRPMTNFYDEIFCSALRASHHHHHHPDYHHADPDPNSHHGDLGSRSIPRDGCFLHSRDRMRNNRRKPSRIGHNLPGFDIPSSSFKFSWPEEEMRRTSEEKDTGTFMRMEEGFYDDIFRSSSNGSGSGGDRRLMRSSRTCRCMLSKSAKSRSQSKSKAFSGSSTSVLSSDQYVISSSIHNQNNLEMPTASASAAHHHYGRHKEEEDAIFSSKLRPIIIPRRSTRTSSKGYDSPPAPSTILSVEREEEDEQDVNAGSSCSQRTSIITVNPLSAITLMDLCSPSSSMPLPLPPPPPPTDHHVKNSSVTASLFRHNRYCYHDQPDSSITTTESTAAAILFSDGLTKPRPNPSASTSGGHNTSGTIHVSNGTAGGDVGDYASRSPSSAKSPVLLEPLATNAAQAPDLDKWITEKMLRLAQEEGDLEIGACESDQSDCERSFNKDNEYINGMPRTHAMTIMMGNTEGAAAVDEAIAWAKEQFWNGSVPTEGV